MLPYELESLLKTNEVHDVMTAIDNPTLQAERGWDLSNWTYLSKSSSIIFLCWGTQGQATEAVVAIHAPSERRVRMESLVADFPLPAKVVMLD